MFTQLLINRRNEYIAMYWVHIFSLFIIIIIPFYLGMLSFARLSHNISALVDVSPSGDKYSHKYM